MHSMIKIIFALAFLSSTLLCVSSAQRPQTFDAEIDTAFEEFLSEAVIFTETELEFSVIIGEYDLVLLDDNEGQIEFSVHTVPAFDATNLEGALTVLLERLGAAIQDGVDEIERDLDRLIGAEEDVDEIKQEKNATAVNIRQFGSELQGNASRISAAIVQSYNRAAADSDTLYFKRIYDQFNDILNTTETPPSANNRDARLKAIADIIRIGGQALQLGSETGPVVFSEVINNIGNVKSQNTSKIIAVNSTITTNSSV